MQEKRKSPTDYHLIYSCCKSLRKERQLTLMLSHLIGKETGRKKYPLRLTER
jgi:hypothetical protein